MGLAVAILVFTCFVNLSLGSFVLARNPRLLSSLSFFALSLNVSAWAVSNYLTESASNLAVNGFFNRLAYLFGFLCLISITVFCFSFPRVIKISSLKKLGFIVFSVTISVLSLTELVAGKVTRENGELHFTIGPLAVIYSVSLLFLLGLSAWRLLLTSKNSELQTRQQIRLILLGFVLSVLLGLAMNLILPQILENFETAKFGPLLTIFIVGTTTYAIYKHRLFDMRLVVARTIAYAGLIASFAGLYAVVVYGLASQVATKDSFAQRELLPVATALLLVVTGPYLKRFFDRATNTVFYRDEYDPQEFLDQLNKTIVSTIEIGILIRHTTAIIADNLKCEYVQIGIRETDSAQLRVIGTKPADFSSNDVEIIKDAFKSRITKFAIADDLGSEDAQLRKMLNRHNISFIVRLTTSSYGEEQGIAYLIFGPKKSGNLYSKRDYQIVEIIADEMVIAIQNALRFEEIQEFNTTLQQKVNDATAKLKKTNEKLKVMDETKDEFISMASHQLRTPLTSVKGYISMVLEGDAGKLTVMQEEMLGQAFTSSQRMVYLIADLLNVSRLKTGKFVIDAKPTNLADVVEGELAQLTEQVKSKNIKLVFEKPTDFPKIDLDETKIRQVIMNFADNALYYTPKGGEVKVELKEDKTNVYFMVKDNGLGVPKDEQKELFTKFYRASNARKARPDGTGLGLYMAKKVVTAQGGEILFESVEGKGSTFGFCFKRPEA